MNTSSKRSLEQLERDFVLGISAIKTAIILLEQNVDDDTTTLNGQIVKGMLLILSSRLSSHLEQFPNEPAAYDDELWQTAQLLSGAVLLSGMLSETQGEPHALEVSGQLWIALEKVSPFITAYREKKEAKNNA